MAPGTLMARASSHHIESEQSDTSRNIVRVYSCVVQVRFAMLAAPSASNNPNITRALLHIHPSSIVLPVGSRSGRCSAAGAARPTPPPRAAAAAVATAATQRIPAARPSRHAAAGATTATAHQVSEQHTLRAHSSGCTAVRASSRQRREDPRSRAVAPVATNPTTTTTCPSSCSAVRVAACSTCHPIRHSLLLLLLLSGHCWHNTT